MMDKWHLSMVWSYFFTAYSDDFGESYTYMETNGRWDIENPQNSDGSYYFTNENGTPADIFIYPSSDGGHFNAFFNDNNQIIAVSAMGINTQENFDSGIYTPAFFLSENLPIRNQ